MLMPFLIIFLLPLLVDGRHDVGVLHTDENWHFLTRFCFRHSHNQLHYRLEYPEEYATQQMYLYYDIEEQWQAVYDTDKTCEQKTAVLKPKNNQLLNLSTVPNQMWNSVEDKFMEETVGCRLRTKEDGQRVMQCVGNRTFNSARSRWWYIAVGNCNSSQGLHLEYDILMTNGPPADWWTYQFSSDEIGILQTDLLFLVVHAVLLLTAALVSLALRSRQMFHRTFKLFLISLSIKCVSLLCLVLARSQFAYDGVGSPSLRLLGQLSDAASTLTMICLLVLLAKGWTVTRGRLSKASGWRIVLFMTLYCVSYAALYIYQLRVFDPAKVLYLYESPAGHLIIALRLVAWAWFVYACQHTIGKYPEKHNFYTRFVVFYSIWFWSGPLTIMSGNYILDKWVRSKVANGIEDLVSALGYVWLLWLTRPSAANLHFPYHVRTGQIAAINEAADLGGEGDKYAATDLPHHAYQVKYTAERDDVFTIASARGGHQPDDVYDSDDNTIGT